MNAASNLALETAAMPGKVHLRKLPLNIPTLLVGLVLASLLPSIALVAFWIQAETNDDIEAARSHIRTLALANAVNTGRVLGETRHLLSVVAQRPQVRRLQRDRCDPLLADFRNLAANVSNLITVNLAGEVVCSAQPLPPDQPLSAAGSDWFRSALREAQFVVGAPMLSPLTHKWISVVAYPLLGEAGHPIGFVAASLGPEAFQPDFSAATLPVNTRYGILAADGTLIWRNIDPNGAIGRKGTLSPMTRKLLATVNGTVDGTGSDDVHRFYAIVPIAEGNLYGYVGVASKPIFDAADMRRATNLKLGALGLLVEIALAILIGRLIVAPVGALASVARDLKAGRRDARAPTAGPHETQHLATAFNLLVDDWQTAQESLRRSSAEIEDLYQNAPCGYHSLDDQARFIRINNTELEWVGYARDDVIGKLRFTDLLSPASREIFATAFPGNLDDGKIHTVELEYLRRDGSLLPVLVSSSAVIDAGGQFVRSRSTVLDLTDIKRANAALAAQAERIQSLSRRLVVVQEEEMRKLSAELHDRTSGNLAALAAHLRRIENLSGPASGELADALADTRGLLEDTNRSIREICAGLRSPVLAYAGLLPALETLTHQFSIQSGIRVILDAVPLPERLPLETESALFRIVQEALANCAKHSGAREVTVYIARRNASGVFAEIKDDGVGFENSSVSPPPKTAGMGLLTMRERAEFLGGRCVISSALGRGTTIRIEL
jgi:PAS domain S-box-containing protein